MFECVAFECAVLLSSALRCVRVCRVAFKFVVLRCVRVCMSVVLLECVVFECAVSGCV